MKLAVKQQLIEMGVCAAMAIVALAILPPGCPEPNMNTVPVHAHISRGYCISNRPTIIEEEIQQTKYYDVPMSTELQDEMFALCEEYGVSPELVLAVIETESGFNPAAVSKTGDYGLMQINKGNHKWLSEKLGVNDFLDATQNMKCGIYMLAFSLNSADGDYTRALMVYNFGLSGARRAWKNGKTSTAYTDKVLENMTKYY